MLTSTCCNAAVMLLDGSLAKCIKCLKANTVVFSTDLGETITVDPKAKVKIDIPEDSTEMAKFFESAACKPNDTQGRSRRD